MSADHNTVRARHARRIGWICLLVFAVAGCAGWHGIEPQRAPRLQEGDVLEFQASGATVRLHAVRFTGDSLSGVPWLKHTSCDSCRVSYATSAISGARVGHPETIGWIVVLVPLYLLYSFVHAFDGLRT
jgi:hypothetical protein